MVTKGVVFYTDNRLDDNLIGQAVRTQLQRAIGEMELISVSLGPLAFGKNIVLSLARSYLTMFEQILTGLEAATADIIFLCEHDVLYHSSHFEFTPNWGDIIYYNTHCWHVRGSDGHALYYTANRVSQLCAYRTVLLAHYRRRVELVRKLGFSYRMGFEPGTHRRSERVDDLKCDTFTSTVPSIDIKYGGNLTPARWKQDDFRNKDSCRDWQEAGFVPFWGITANRFDNFLQDICEGRTGV